MSLAPAQSSGKGILAPKTRDQESGKGLIRSRGLHFREGQRAVRELLGMGLQSPGELVVGQARRARALGRGLCSREDSFTNY